MGVLQNVILESVMDMNKYIENIANAIVNMDEDNINGYIDEALQNGVSEEDIYNIAFSEGMLKVTNMFEDEEYYVSEVIVCADTLNMGINYLQSKSKVKMKSGGPTVVIGVVEGDLHEIGKNIVKIMFGAAGFNVIDLGQNVKASDFIKKAEEVNADIIGLSTMMTTTMPNMEEVVKLNNRPHKPYIIIGGGPVSEDFRKEISADGFSKNAVEAVELVKELMSRELA